MISAEIYTKVMFDEKGKEKIEDAVFTIREIIDALNKAGGSTDGIVDDLEEAESVLRAILEGTIW